MIELYDKKIKNKFKNQSKKTTSQICIYDTITFEQWIFLYKPIVEFTSIKFTIYQENNEKIKGIKYLIPDDYYKNINLNNSSSNKDSSLPKLNKKKPPITNFKENMYNNNKNIGIINFNYGVFSTNNFV